MRRKSKTAEVTPSRDRSVASRRALLTALLAIFATWSTRSHTQSASDANEIIRSLAPVRGQIITPGYGGQRRQPVQIQGATIYVDTARSVALEVYFAFGSFDLTDQARAQLAALGSALSSPQLVPYRYLIAGHTDAVGSDTLNLDLSQRRAAAVRDYLVSAFPIDPYRLVALGFGYRHLKRPAMPHAAINRRVEVLLIVPRSDAVGMR